MLTTIKVYVFYAVKIYKKQTQQIFKRGGVHPVFRVIMLFFLYAIWY